MSEELTPGKQYADAAYVACMQGRADSLQQQSVAVQIALLHGVNGELLDALRDLLAMFLQALCMAQRDTMSEEDVALIAARNAIAKATTHI